MNCQECRKLLSEYCDHDLAETLASEVQGHLEKCPDCQEQHKLMETIAVTAKSLPHPSPSMECMRNAIAAIHKRAGFSRRTEFGPVLDFEELTEFLRVDRKIIGQYLDEIPSFELGGKLLFRRKSVEAWIESKEMCFGIQWKEINLDNIKTETYHLGGLK